ncbi:pantoate--beta-alanine ligase [Nocardioides sp.]|uniref:pantoate--beta-alanine ligase n=1 Tax=Nocardioides sp. TaxID=35761 RepID=UPI002D7E3CB3|nr:pantoate--beta-alanine ligase [Nocardioides sp.]HET8959697.1 pantoate--beta-alanine ligase [Nocardioides sp.]
MTASPLLATTREELAGHLDPARRDGEAVAFVPTMGALHDGHARLMQVARERSTGPVVVSIFVNPLQFGVGEDLDRYPRPLEEDLKVCEREGVDIVFLPGVDEVYPGGDPQVTVEPGPLGTVLEGAVRPGHFRGVLTVVAKLFGLVRPGIAVFGQKDYQQLVLVRRMVRDLCLDVEVVGAETQREPDGLALSSRNSYLDAAQRRQATVLSRGLLAARDAAGRGPEAALEAARTELGRTSGVELDYLVVTDPELGELPPDPPAGTAGRILVAGRVGSTRLIDNLPLTFGPGPLAESH